MARASTCTLTGDWPMCFTEPGRVTAMNGSMVRVETADGEVDASLRMVEAGGRRVGVGDWVLMSLGLVVEVVDGGAGRQLVEQMRRLGRDAVES